MSDYPEDEGGDLDIRDLLDELTNRSIDSIIGMWRCSLLLERTDLSIGARQVVLNSEFQYARDLDEVNMCWKYLTEP